MALLTEVWNLGEECGDRGEGAVTLVWSVLSVDARGTPTLDELAALRRERAEDTGDVPTQPDGPLSLGPLRSLSSWLLCDLKVTKFPSWVWIWVLFLESLKSNKMD